MRDILIQADMMVADEAIEAQTAELLQQIGEGGFGVVYMAEQTEPVRRKVALKIIKPGMDTKAVIARFESERQALALMDHPNIARVLGAGATPRGRPHFVLEMGRGGPPQPEGAAPCARPGGRQRARPPPALTGAATGCSVRVSGSVPLRRCATCHSCASDTSCTEGSSATRAK